MGYYMYLYEGRKVLAPASIFWIWNHYTVAFSDNKRQEPRHKGGTGIKISMSDYSKSKIKSVDGEQYLKFRGTNWWLTTNLFTGKPFERKLYSCP